MEKVMDLRMKNLRAIRCIGKLDHQELRRLYEVVCKLLVYEHGQEMIQTKAENSVYLKIKRITKLEVLRSVWIGNNNVDLFLPSLKSESNFRESSAQFGFKGLVIEVDGGVHNSIVKMKKDQRKYENLDYLSIGVICISNEDLNSIVVRDIIHSFNRSKKLDTRGKLRLMRNIYIHTIICQKDLIVKHNNADGIKFLKFLGVI